MDYRAAIDRFIDETCPVDGRVKKRLNDSMEILRKHGIETPTETDYEEVLIPALCDVGKSRKTAGGYVTAMRKFERWQAQQEGDDRVRPTETPSNEPQIEAKPDSETKRGKRDRVQVSTYLSPEDYEALKEIAFVSQTDMSAIIAQAIGSALRRNEGLRKQYQAIKKLMNEAGTLSFDA